MSVITATAEDLRLVKDIIRTSTHRQVNLGEEDLANLVDIGAVLLAIDSGGVWGIAAFHHEPHPGSLPLDAPDRVYLRAVAFLRTTSPSSGLHELLTAYAARPSPAARMLIAYGGDGWFDRALQAAGLQRAEQVCFFELTDLRHSVERLPPCAEPAYLRSAVPEDIDALAQVDAATFDLIWQMTALEL